MTIIFIWLYITVYNIDFFKKHEGDDEWQTVVF